MSYTVTFVILHSISYTPKWNRHPIISVIGKFWVILVSLAVFKSVVTTCGKSAQPKHKNCFLKHHKAGSKFYYTSVRFCLLICKQPIKFIIIPIVVVVMVSETNIFIYVVDEILTLFLNIRWLSKFCNTFPWLCCNMDSVIVLSFLYMPFFAKQIYKN